MLFVSSSRCRSLSAGGTPRNSVDIERPTHLRKPELQRTVRFPSSDIDHNTFIRIDSWNNRNNRSDAETAQCKQSIRDRLTSWWENLSRKNFIILVTSALIVLFLIALALVLIIVFVINGNNDPNDPKKNNPTTMTPTSPGSSTTRTLPFLKGSVSGSASHFYPIYPLPESVEPDLREYKFRNRFIGYGNGTLFLTDSDRIDTNYTQIEFDLSEGMDNSTCSNCTVLAVADECFNQTEADNCTVSKSIFCCYNCTGLSSTFCYVQGVIYRTSGLLIEQRVSASAASLSIVTSSLQQTCSFQLHRIDSSPSQFYDGPLEHCYVPAPNTTTPIPPVQLQKAMSVASVTANIQKDPSFSYLVFVDEQGSVVIVNQSAKFDLLFGPVQLDISGPIVNLTVSFYAGERILIAIVQKDKFYVVRFNTKSQCISILLSKFHKFQYDGELQKGEWIDEKLLLWFRTEDGPNMVVFTFLFPSDAYCVY
ncbi:hypothetical protein WR25_26645 isoform B [Diploscapter pachys]|uniref:Uncharacterized protein n=2 Tax=Diploscapter pachys TaxID=2018661 RepID=A0A2A2KHR7_9BILA|nr:hypothetical protein WR25_26645 isoform B [Diploscapter pachys]